jgi:hypothetical protein
VSLVLLFISQAFPILSCVPCCACHPTTHFQANIDRSADPAEWAWDKLAGKLAQYCTLLEGLTGDDLRKNSNVSYQS